MTAKDVEAIYDVHRSTASRKLAKIKEYFNKPVTGDVRYTNSALIPVYH
jgi:hypothetical protein